MVDFSRNIEQIGAALWRQAMQDLADHPFSAENIARESGIPDQTECSWLRFCAECERLLGHDLDGNDTAGFDCGYSIDEAHDKWQAGYAASAYVAMVVGRDRYRTNTVLL